MKGQTLRERTASGLMWGLLSNGAMQVLGALFGVVLLRLLNPSDYGKIAMLLVFSTVAGSLQESGFTAALCNLRRPSHNDYNAVFWFNTLMSLIIYGILCACAPLIALLYRDPDLTLLSRVYFLALPITALGQVQRAHLFIELRNRETAIIGVCSLLCSGVVGVAMAWKGMAYWGLAGQHLTFVGCMSVGNWMRSRWRPTLAVDLRPAFRLFGFSSKLLLTNLFTNLNAHAFGVLLGRFYGAHQAGIYSNARKWDDMCANTVNGMVSGVAQPVLSRVNDQRERHAAVFRKMLRFVSFVSFPVMLTMGLCAREFLWIVGGEKWMESASLLTMLSIYGAIYPIATLYQNLALSRSRSGLNLCLTVVVCVLIWGGLIALRSYGLSAMVVFFVALNGVWLCVWQLTAGRLIGLRFVHLLKDVMPFALSAALCVVVARWAADISTDVWVRLGVKAVASAALYLGAMTLSGAKIMRQSYEYCLSHLGAH